MKSALVLSGSLVFMAGSEAAQAQTNLAPEAQRVLSAACQYLAEAPHFSLNAEIWREHVTDSGQKLQFSRTVAMEVKRPNRLHVEITSPHSQRGFWYDGKGLTILDRQHGFFSTNTMPDTLDAAVDEAQQHLGIDLPLIDLAMSEPYKNATAKVVKGTYYGLAPVLGVNCHHLAFTQDNVDWQLWVQEGPQPLIRKLVITHKLEAGEPEFTAMITHWNMTDRISDSDFVFEAPLGAARIEMRRDPADGERGGNSAPTGPKDR